MARKKRGPRITRTGVMWGALIAIVVGALCFAVAIAWDRSRPQDITSGILTMPLQSDDHVVGNRNASIVLFVYTDSECPYCKHFDEVTMPKLQQQYGKALAVVYRDFPLDGIHPLARHEMEAAECAAVQDGDDAYFGYLNDIFSETHSNETFPTSELPAIAQRLGLNMVDFQECLSSGATATRVQADVVDGAAAGLTITPSIVVQVNGRRALVSGDYYSSVLAAIQYLQYASATTSNR